MSPPILVPRANGTVIVITSDPRRCIGCGLFVCFIVVNGVRARCLCCTAEEDNSAAVFTDALVAMDVVSPHPKPSGGISSHGIPEPSSEGATNGKEE